MGNVDDDLSGQRLIKELQTRGYALITLTSIENDGDILNSQELIKICFEECAKFFPAAESDPRIAEVATSKTSSATRGYSRPNTENFRSLVGEKAGNDHVAKFRVGPPHLKDEPKTSSNTKESGSTESKMKEIGSTPWPKDIDSLSGFAPACKAVYAALETVAFNCGRLLGESCDLPVLSEALVPGTTSSVLSLNWYKLSEEELLARNVDPDESVCIHEHTDVSLFTLIGINKSELAQGLQCKRPDTGEWESILPSGDRLVLIAGDLLEDWTNGKIKATRHFVPLPTTHHVSRLSAVFFVTPPVTFLVCDGSMTFEKWRKKRVKKAMAALKRYKNSQSS
eukprot:m.39726 g.39726  ORF g.39726 m.39726 type:complete len:339 (+) comp9585_c0_seq1:165-1181(+)